jgi:tetratricopeptide (TPR) repeat protein
VPDPITSIPGNTAVLERARQHIAAGEAIAFVGAGASAPLYPLWDSLIRTLLGEALERGLVNEADRDYLASVAARSPQQAVRGIKERLGRPLYGALMRDLFSPRSGADGKRYTSTHGALLRLPFRGYATTNYDPGLLEARLDQRRDVSATGYATWQDPELLQGWLDDSAFGPGARPILYAHGVWERSSTMVLEAGEYRSAYRPGMFRELVRKLWSQERLVFVGFGFSDSWFDFVADEVLDVTSRQGAAAPRHVALLGLLDSTTYSPEMRRHFHAAYDAEVIFYPVRIVDRDGVATPDHGMLAEALKRLESPEPEPGTTGPVVAPEVVARPDAPPAPPELWVHQSSDDEHYVARRAVVDRLNRWAEDPSVRGIAVTGMGGLGKTALVGNWLKHQGGQLRRETRGLFFWSFYSNADVGALLNTLRTFVGDDGSGRFEARMLAEHPLLIVLDGVEVLQASPDDEHAQDLRYGEFVEFRLREFLDACCRLEHGGLVVLTSRFPFADLTSYLGRTLRLLELPALTPVEGAALLARSGVEGSEADRREVSRRLEGHALGLRVYAATHEHRIDAGAARLSDAIFAELDDDAPLEAKLRHVLEFYERSLPQATAVLVGLVSLFADPVTVGSVLVLARRLPEAAADLARLSDDDVERVLTGLERGGLVTAGRDERDSSVYACHPVVRDHFRRSLLERDRSAGAAAAGLLTSQPERVPSTAPGLRAVVNAIELLIDSGEYVEADRLYRTRLDDGMLFMRFPARREGWRCARAFVADAERCGEALGEHRLGYFFNEVGLFGMYLVDPVVVTDSFDAAERAFRATGRAQDLGMTLRNRAMMLISEGRLHEAEVVAREALQSAASAGHTGGRCASYGWLGTVLGHLGRLPEALEAFQASIRAESIADGVPGSVVGVEFAELLGRHGLVGRARSVSLANLANCQRNRWWDDKGRCELSLARLDVEADPETAAARLDRAEAIFRRGQVLDHLPSLLLVKAALAHRSGDHADALAQTNAALGIAAPHRLRLAHADALVQRGTIMLDRFATGEGDRGRTAARALDDGEAALVLARDCAYRFGERAAHTLLEQVHSRSGDHEQAEVHRRGAEALSARLRLPSA